MKRNLRAEVCVGAAIFRDGRVLLLRRSPRLKSFPGMWDLPGGHVERDEGLLRALRREVWEETRLKVVVDRVYHAWNYAYPTGHEGRVPTVEIDFLCRVPRGSLPRVNLKEHVEFSWVAHDELQRYPSSRLLAPTLRCAFREVERLPLRRERANGVRAVRRGNR